jgi:hypothetical protein
MRVLAALFTFLAVGGSSWCLAADTPVVGSVKTVEGSASIIRGGEVLTAHAGQLLEEKDTLQTGPDGSLGVIFRDDSVLSLGPDSKLAIERFVFNPAEGNLEFISRIWKGTAAYLSGLIGKLSPESVRFETPVATIGIRGTRFAAHIEG